MTYQKYPYSKTTAHEHPGNEMPITDKQLAYIDRLSTDTPVRFRDIIASIKDLKNKDIQYATKGQAMFVIKCLLGEIRPYPEHVITPGATQIPLVCSCGCDHIIRSEVVGDTYLQEYCKCGCREYGWLRKKTDPPQHIFYDPNKGQSGKYVSIPVDKTPGLG